MSYKEVLLQDARLVILIELTKQTDWRLNETILVSVLDTFGYNHSRDWVRTQLRQLEELGVLKVHTAGKIMVAELLQLGLDHVERRTIVEGIKRPSPEA